jgi:hypothetical protein
MQVKAYIPNAAYILCGEMATEAMFMNLPPEDIPTRQRPTPATSETLIVKGQAYEILRFREGAGPNLAEAIEIAGSRAGKRMLTYNEACEIKENSESSAAFKTALGPGKWSFVRNQESEPKSLASYLLSERDTKELHVGDDSGPDFASWVIILKSVDGEPPAQQRQKGQGDLLRKAGQAGGILLRGSGAK